MKTTILKIVSVILATTMILGITPFAFAEEKAVDIEQKINELIDSVGSTENEMPFSILGISEVRKMAVDENLTSGMFVYSVDENEEATITGLVYDEITSEIVIPDEIDGYPVVAVEDAVLTTAMSITLTENEFPAVTSLYIGKSIKYIGSFSNFTLERITVDEENEIYSSVDGVLYNKDKTQIILIPSKKEFERLEINDVIKSPEDIENITARMMCGVVVDEMVLGNGFINSLYEFVLAAFDEPVEGLTPAYGLGIFDANEYADFYLRVILSSVKAKRFTVSESNSYVCVDEYGVLYNKNQTVLIKYPIGNTEIKLYTIAENVDLRKLHGHYGASLIGLSGSPFMAMSVKPSEFLILTLIGIMAAQVYSGIDFENVTEEAMELYIYYINRLKNDLSSWFIESAPAGLIVHVPDRVMATLPADQILPSTYQGGLTDHNLTGANICVSNDVDLSVIYDLGAGLGNPEPLEYPAKVSGYNAMIATELAEFEEANSGTLGNFDNSGLSKETIDRFNKVILECVEAMLRATPLDEFEICGGGHITESPDGPEEPDNPEIPELPPIDETVMPTPTQTTIKYGDSIVLHVDESKIPAGGYVEWTSSNGNFDMDVSADGKTCTITPEKSGETTFTATIYDADGKVVSVDDQEMTSKAGFFNKLIAFFKRLFGLTKVIPQIIK